MLRLEQYITPILMSYVSRFIQNISPDDLKVSLWGGDVLLKNLELRLDVLESALPPQIKLRRGVVREVRDS